MTTSAGCRSAAWARSSSAELWAARAVTRNRSGAPCRTSTAWVPIEPVDPSRLTERITSSEMHGLDHEVRGREDEEEPVNPVEQAAMARHEPSHVLQSEVTLDHRLAQIAQRCHHGHHDPEHEGLADRPGMDEVDHHHGHHNGGQGAADE